MNLKSKEEKWKKPNTLCKIHKKVLVARTALYSYDIFQYSYNTIEKNKRPMWLPTLYLLWGFDGRSACIHQQPDSASTEVT